MESMSSEVLEAAWGSLRQHEPLQKATGSPKDGVKDPLRVGPSYVQVVSSSFLTGAWDLPSKQQLEV